MEARLTPGNLVTAVDEVAVVLRGDAPRSRRPPDHIKHGPKKPRNEPPQGIEHILQYGIRSIKPVSQSPKKTHTGRS